MRQRESLISYYQNLYKNYGYSEKSLGWTKNKQIIRFKTLLRFLQLQEAELLDIGCGFGDMLTYITRNLDNYHINYQGIDIMEEFIEQARILHGDLYDNRFHCGDFMAMECPRGGAADYIVASGVFGFRLFDSEDEQYRYIDRFIRKSLEWSRKAAAMDFLSDKVDYHSGTTDFHANPQKILEIAYKHSRNVILDNSVMPFEFCLTIFKDDSFRKETTVFNAYLEGDKSYV